MNLSDPPEDDGLRPTAPPGHGPTRIFRASGVREAFARVKAELEPETGATGPRETPRSDADPDAEAAQRFEVIAAFPGAAGKRTEVRAWKPPVAWRSSATATTSPPAPRHALGRRATVPPELRPKPAEPQLGALQDAIRSIEAQLTGLLEANRAIHDELAQLSHARLAAEPSGASAALLTAAGVARDVAETLVRRALERVAPHDDASAPRTPDLAEEIHRTLQVARPLWHQPSGTVCALIGPTGAGKTTTLLKVAALARFAHGRTVGLVTTDVERIGAYEQLALFCDVMGLPLAAAADRASLDDALDGFAGVDLVLVDTPGHNPFDERARRSVLRALASREVTQHLVLPATLTTRLIADTVERYSGPSLTSLILTKVDEARGLGALLAVAMATDLPVSHTCDGQEIPDAIHAVDRGRVIRELLGQPS